VARFALIKAGKVENVIVADPAFLANADPAWLAQYDAITEIVRPGETAATGAAAVETRDAEPGATIAGRNITRPVREAPPPTLEDRIAALEAAAK